MTKISPDISFEDLTFTANNRKGIKIILNKISGTFPSGKLIGILGPSGAGKTTLLNILSGWDHNSQITGSIKINNIERKLSDFKNISCYITQDNHFVDLLTAEENLQYAADFKLGRFVSKTTKEQIINDVVDSFGLTEHLKTQTGQLSGGQRKRLAICLGLLSDPDVIFLDEPTTGLDIVSMSQCIRHLKKRTELGNTVICTLHQPPDNVAKMFDILYIVAQGQCAFQGSPQELVTFLQDNHVPCDIFHSPLDYIIEITNNEYGSKVLETLLNASENGKNKAYMPHLTKQTQTGRNTPETKSMFHKLNNYSFNDDLYELGTMMKREFLKSSRDIILTYLRVTAVLIYSVGAGLVSYNIGQDATRFFYNYNLVLLHLAVVAITFSVISSVGFTQTQLVVRNEYENGYYSIRNYFLTSSLFDIPITILSVTVGTIIVYWLSGQLMTWHRMFMFIVLSNEVALIGSSYGFIFGTLFNINNAVFGSMAVTVPMFGVSGYSNSMLYIPRPFFYMSYFAYPRYALRSMLGTFFGYNRPPAPCDEETIYCHYQDSAKFLAELGMEDYYFVYDAIALAGFYLSAKLVSYLAIRYRLKGGNYLQTFT